MTVTRTSLRTPYTTRRATEEPTLSPRRTTVREPDDFEAPRPRPTSLAPVPPPPPTPVAAAALASRVESINSLGGSPQTMKAAQLVSRDTKLATLVQVAPAAQQAALRAELKKLTPERLDAAFSALLSASRTVGTKQLRAGSFTVPLSVSANGAVNGAPLRSDRELAVSLSLANLSHRDRASQLAQAGVSAEWLRHASHDQVLRAFTEVETRRRFGPVGAFELSLGSVVTQPAMVGEGFEQPEVRAEGAATFRIDSKRHFVIDGVSTRPAGERALAALVRRETAAWPGGTPDQREVRLYSPRQFSVPRSEKVTAVLAALPPTVSARVKGLLDGNTVTDASIDAAFEQVLAARASRGTKTLALELVTRELGPEQGEAGASVTERTHRFSATVSVAGGGVIDGKRLHVDELARLASQLASLAPEVKDEALRQAGLSKTWVALASDAHKAWALAKLRVAGASDTPQRIDVGYTLLQHSESGASESKMPGTLVTTGKPPFIEKALATQLAMEKLSMVEKRALVAQLGLPFEAVREIGAATASSLLTRVSLATATPGQHTFDARIDGDTWRVAVKVGPNGALEGAGAVKLPPEPPTWKKVLGPVLTLASFVFPPVAPIAQTLNAVMALANGARGLTLVASIAGAASGLSTLTGASSAATLSSVATALSATDGMVKSLESKDLLGAFASFASLAGSVGSLAGATLDGSFDTLRTAARVAQYGSAVVNKDLVSLLGLAVGDALTSRPATQATPAEPDERAGSVEPQPPPSAAVEDDGSQEPVGPPLDVSGGTITTATARTQKVVSGDNLTKLATQLLGDPALAPELYAWNAARIGANPNLLRVGAELEVPPPGFRLSAEARNDFFRSTRLPVVAPRSEPSAPIAETTPEARQVMGEISRVTEELSHTTDVATRTDLLEYLNGLKLKVELGLGLKKVELSWDADGLHLEFKPASATFEAKAGTFKLVGEPTFAVTENGIEVSAKVAGAVGPVEVGLKGVVGADGRTRFEPVVGATRDLFGVGGKVFGVGATAGVEVGAPRTVTRPPPESPFYGSRGAIAP